MRIYSFEKTEKYKNMERWQQLSVCQECGKDLKPGDIYGDTWVCYNCYENLDEGGIEVSQEKKVFTEKDLHELLRPLREVLCPSLEYERDETCRIMEEDRD